MAIINLHGIPPINHFNMSQAQWKERKKYWLSLGMKSEMGREHVVVYDVNVDYSNASDMAKVSIFNPVLTEILYNWFSSKTQKILDPFAGGSVRGIVASMMDRQYTGIDLRQEQIISNKEQLNIVDGKKFKPNWLCGDSFEVMDTLEDESFDLVFSCPPYGNLEVYSDDKNDLSNKDWEQFLIDYQKIIEKSIRKLKNNRFAIFVVGDFRDKKTGFYNPLTAKTTDYFIDAGAGLYNFATIVSPYGSLPLRANIQMERSRKLGNTLQNVLIFCKGNPKQAVQDMNKIEPDQRFAQFDEKTLF